MRRSVNSSKATRSVDVDVAVQRAGLRRRAPAARRVDVSAAPADIAAQRAMSTTGSRPPDLMSRVPRRSPSCSTHEVTQEPGGRPGAERELAQPPQQLRVTAGAREDVLDRAPAGLGRATPARPSISSDTRISAFSWSGSSSHERAAASQAPSERRNSGLRRDSAVGAGGDPAALEAGHDIGRRGVSVRSRTAGSSPSPCQAMALSWSELGNASRRATLPSASQV